MSLHEGKIEFISTVFVAIPFWVYLHASSEANSTPIHVDQMDVVAAGLCVDGVERSMFHIASNEFRRDAKLTYVFSFVDCGLTVMSLYFTHGAPQYIQ